MLTVGEGMLPLLVTSIWNVQYNISGRHTFSDKNLAGTDINSSSEFITSYVLKITPLGLP